MNTRSSPFSLSASTIRDILVAASTVTLFSACTSMMESMHSQQEYSQDNLPDAIKVPAGHKVAWQTVGVGDITYECRDKADAPGQLAWVFAGPNAVLNDRGDKQVGRYYGPPATWESLDGSKVSGAQLAVAPSSLGNIPYQLVKANPATGEGAMTGVTYIQRVATQGGVAPASVCAAAPKGKRETVKYQADYIFWKAK